MLETRDMYKDYINSINTKINMVNIKIQQYYASQEYIKTCIINNRTEFEKVNVNIDTLFSNPYIAYAKIKDLVDTGNLSRVAHYVQSYVRSINYLTLHKKLHERLTKSLMPYEVYLKILGYSNFEIAKYILLGGIYSFGNLGKLYIREKARTFLFKGKPVKLPVDWGTSNKFKKELIQQGRTPYNKENAPSGIKWHSYHNSDFAYWFWWEAGAIINRRFFKFYPSKHCKVGNSSKIDDFYKTCKVKEDILNTTKIGILNKMLLLIRFDPLHYLNYRRPEREKKKVFEVQYVN